MSHCILAVDDLPGMREVYYALLSEEGYEVMVAKDGHEALSLLESQSPDLILLDIDMPGLTGWEVLETVRSNGEWQEIPVIMVTALTEPPSIERDSYTHYDCYVTKKQTGNDLLELVEQALSGDLPRPAADGI